ncbi:MAG: hypothetical protein R6V55_05455 [Desulfovermiculus sp.]
MPILNGPSFDIVAFYANITQEQCFAFLDPLLGRHRTGFGNQLIAVSCNLLAAYDDIAAKGFCLFKIYFIRVASSIAWVRIKRNGKIGIAVVASNDFGAFVVELLSN